MCVARRPDDTDKKTDDALLAALAPPDVRKQTGPAAEILDGAILSGIELGDAISFENMALRNVDFTDMSLQGATFTNAVINDADFTNSDLQGADLTNADLRHSDFTNTDLRRVDLAETDLYGANFTNADLIYASLTHANLNYADLTNGDLFEADLSTANLQKADLTHASLLNAILTDADLEEAILTNAILIGSNFTSANLREATLIEANLVNANLTNAGLQSATLTDAALRHANLTDATLYGADFTDANLLYADLTDTHHAGTNLRRANLEGASLSNADLDQADLTDARLHNCRLQGVYISETTMFGNRCIYERAADPYDILPWEVVGPSMEPVTLTAADHRLYQGGRLAAAWHRFRYWTGRLPDRSPDTDDIENIEKAISIYRTYQRLHRENSLPGDIPKYYYREKERRRVKALAERDIRGWLYRALQRWVMGYGERPWRVIGTSLGVIVGFGLLYPFIGGMESNDTDTIPFTLAESFSLPLGSGLGRIFFENLYFSAVTFTTLGYGDIQPGSDTARLLASIESFLGALLMALLVAVFARRTMR